MQRMFARGRVWVVAAALAAFAVPLLSPTPAAAWWVHHGWGWHPGWGYHWRGCCWRPGVIVGVAPPVVLVPRQPWGPGYWHGPYWGPGRWGW